MIVQNVLQSFSCFLVDGAVFSKLYQSKRKRKSQLDFEEAAFSPPENDDSFLYIRYPQDIARKLKSPILVTNSPNITIETASGSSIDVDNHTDPCRQYILKPEYHPTINVNNTTDIKIKSNGVDDGFKGEGAACGSSVIRFAHQMVSGKYISPPPNSSDQDDQLKPISEALSKRRGSKSLPASPLSTPHSSPKSKRRLGHKYFTGAFVESEETNHTGGWLLHGLLSKRDVSQSVSNLAAREDIKLQTDLVKAVSELHLHDNNEKKSKKEFKAKPSEFREMNFWSPTSM